MGSVFAMQGFGQLGAAIVTLVVTAAFKSKTNVASVALCTDECRTAVDRMWRLVVGMGAVPGCIALYYRLTIPETPRYTFDVARDTLKGAADASAFLHNDANGVVDPASAAAVAMPRGTARLTSDSASTPL